MEDKSLIMKHIKKAAYHIILTPGMVTCPISSATLVTNMDIELWNVMSLRRKFKRVPLKKQSVGDATLLGIQQIFVTPSYASSVKDLGTKHKIA